MKRVTITIDGTAYPCSPSMGAMLRFKQETGREISSIDGGSVTDLCTYLYCCVVSAARREGKKFNMSLMDFADRITPENMDEWNRALSEEQGTASDEKKSL